MSDLVRQAESAIESALERGDVEAALAEAARYRQMATGPLLEAGQPAPAFRALLVSARVCLPAGRPSEAGEYLERCLTCIGNLTPVLAARVRLLAAESQFRCGNDTEARRLVDQASPGPWTQHPTLWLRWLRIRLWLGDLPSLANDLAACARLFSQTGDQNNLALLRCEEGLARDRAGDLAGAEAAFAEAECLAQGGAGAILADAAVQRGRLAHLRGRFADAVRHYQQAQRHGLPVQALEARLRTQLVLLDLGQWDAVRSEVAELTAPGRMIAEELRPLVGLLRFLTTGEATGDLSPEAVGFDLARQGRQEEARIPLTNALASERGPERQARLRLALGLLERGPEGNDHLGKAERLARDHGLGHLLERALLARGERLADQDEAAARLLFEEANALGEAEAQQAGPWIASLQRRRSRGALRCLLEAACCRSDPAAVLNFQERERGRLLLHWLANGADGARRTALFDRPDWQQMAAELLACEQALRSSREGQAALGRRRGELLALRDRLMEQHLLEADRPAALLPAVPRLDELSTSLPPGTLYLAPVLGSQELYLLAATDRGAEVVRAGAADPVRQATIAIRLEVERQMCRYDPALPLDGLDPDSRMRLDARLDDLGHGPLGRSLDTLLERHAPGRILWAADEELHGLPLPALRLGGRYLIERVEVCSTPAAALVCQQRRQRHRRGSWRVAVALAESTAELPAASREAEGVAAAFLRGRWISGPAADRRLLRDWLRRARVVHLACHAEFEADRPLAARLRLPSGEVLHALEWLDEPVRGLALVTLSACRAGAVAALAPATGETFGLVTGLLAAGVRAVVAGLWLVADAEAPPLIWSFYRHLMLRPPAEALALAQREALARPASSPLFWAAFALFGDALAVPAPGPLWRALARWRQRRHARRFPGADVAVCQNGPYQSPQPRPQGEESVRKG